MVSIFESLMRLILPSPAILPLTPVLLATLVLSSTLLFTPAFAKQLTEDSSQATHPQEKAWVKAQQARQHKQPEQPVQLVQLVQDSQADPLVAPPQTASPSPLIPPLFFYRALSSPSSSSISSFLALSSAPWLAQADGGDLGDASDANADADASPSYTVRGVVTGGSPQRRGLVTLSLLKDNSKIAQTKPDEDGNFSFTVVGDQTVTVVLNEGFAEISSVIVRLEGGQDPEPLAISLEKLQRLNVVVADKGGRAVDAERSSLQVSSFNRQRIEDSAITDMNDLSSASANFYTLDTGSSSSLYLSLRGMTSVATVDPIVVFYIDGIAEFQTLSSPLQLINIESIDIYKGSQNTLYGRNAIGGVIDIKTRKPKNRFSGNVSVEIDSLLEYLVGLNLSTPVFDNVFSFRLGGYYSGFRGDVYNFTREEWVGGHSNFLAYLDLVFALSPEVELIIGGSFEGIDEEAFSYTSSVVNDFYGIRDEAFANPYRVYYNEDNQNLRYTGEATVYLDVATENFNLTSATAYQNLDVRFIVDADFLPDDLALADIRATSHLVTEELRFSSTGATSRYFDWTTGTYLYYQNRQNDSAINIELNLDDSNVKLNTTQNYFGAAFFLTLSIPLAQQVTLVLGSRIDVERKNETIDKDIGQTEATLSDAVDRDETKTEWFYTPKLAFNFQIIDALSLYVSATRGFRSGGLNNFITDEDLLFVDQEQSWQAEVGLKARHPRVFLDTSVFYTYWENQQVNFFVEDEFFEFGLYNAERSYSVGVDLEADIPIYYGLAIDGSLGYVHSRILKLVDPGGDVIEDKQQPFVPELTGSVALKHSYNLKIGKVDFSHVNRIEYRHVSDIFYDYQNEFRADDYGLLNISSTIRVYGLVVSVFFKNILNTRYVAFSLPLGLTTPVSLGPPFNFGTKISFYF